MLSRLRAALTPGMIAWIAAVFLLFGWFSASREESSMTQLEQRISKTLSAMEGAGDVQVVIMTRENSAETGGTLGYGSSKKGDAAALPCGAIAVAEGADDPLVNMQMTQALCALLGLPASSVSVVTGTGGR